MIITQWRHLWRQAGRLDRYTFWRDAIRADSFVMITASEALGAGRRGFVGAAPPILVSNVAPQDGSVQFSLSWQSQFGALDIWTDFLVFDGSDRASEHLQGGRIHPPAIPDSG